MVYLGLQRTPQSAAEALGTGAVPADLAAILVLYSRTARMPEERSGRGLHSFLVHLALGEVLFTGLERVMFVRVDPDGRVHLMNSTFSVRVNV